MTLSAMQVIDARVRLPFDQRPESSLAKPLSYTQRYDEVLSVGERRTRSTNELIADMEEAGVSKAILHAEYEWGDFADSLNEAVANLVAELPELFFGIGTVSLENAQPMRLVRQAEQVNVLGLKGINIQPAFFGMPIDDPCLYPMYATASDLGLVVAIHTGINYTLHRPMDLERPELLDRVACNFPDLRLIACHAAWPWVDALCGVMRRHKNVYADFGGLAPRYVGEENTGWQTLRRLMDGPLSQQVLFATDWPVFPMDRAIREWGQMGLKPQTLGRLLSENALALFDRKSS